MLVGLEQAVADTRSMARTIGRAGAVAELGAGLPRRVDRDARPRRRAPSRDADADGVRAVRARPRVDRRAAGTAPRGPARGALVVNLRNILEAMAPVAAAQPVRVHAR